MNIQKVLGNLRRRGFTAMYFETPDEAVEYILNNTAGKTVGIGGSMTIKELELYEKLSQQSTVYWHWEQSSDTVFQCASNAQIYIASANALSAEGEIVNIDGTGNRIASTLYGHEKLILVIGINKIADNLNCAIDRAKNIAAPLNARRLNRKTPCAMTNPMHCHDCNSPERICRGMTIISHSMQGIGCTDVLLIGKPMGF